MESLARQIKENWGIISFFLGVFVTLVIWYANTNSRLNAVEAQVTEQITIQKDITDLKIDMAVVKNSVLNIEKKLDN